MKSSSGKTFTFYDSYSQKTFLVDVNNFLLPINNGGITADVYVQFPDTSSLSGGRFEESICLYSGGFWLSGYSNGELWTNGVASASRMVDYVPGKVGSDPNDSLNLIHIIRSSDPPFGPAWRNWENAVTQGADYYDGNGDEIYSPIDLNGNGKWDKNEDRPDLLGDLTAWCVFNDGVPSDERLFNYSSPKGIEIRQTVFGYSPESINELNSVIFIRYSILNTGLSNETLDSVYFSIFTDPDLGEYYDDLVGCDTLLNSSYTYNKGDDYFYGVNPPAFLTQVLQGPPTYIPGETFLDNNDYVDYDHWEKLKNGI